MGEQWRCAFFPGRKDGGTIPNNIALVSFGNEARDYVCARKRGRNGTNKRRASGQQDQETQRDNTTNLFLEIKVTHRIFHTCG